MIHSTHKLKAYMGDVNKPCVFCQKCGKEENEGLEEPCTGKFIERTVDKLKEPN